MNGGNPVPRHRMSDIAFARIRDAIVTGELRPGARVKDIELAEHLGLSRTPVREALARLVDIGLAEAKPAAYTRITTLNRGDVETTLAVIGALDHLAVTCAVPNLTADMVAAMRAANDEFAEAVERNDIAAALTADDRLHGVLIDAAGNPLLKKLLHQVHPQIHRIYYRKFSTLLGGHETVEHHRRLIDLCATHDGKAAAELSAIHRRHLGGLIAELFEANEFVEAE
ncbi:GntR family transcriptional regulator [Nocardia brasiliensis]